VTVLEDPANPTFLSLTAMEWHAFGYGLKEGLWFWKRTPLAWDAIKSVHGGFATGTHGYKMVRQEAIIWIANESHPIHSGCSYSVVRYW